MIFKLKNAKIKLMRKYKIKIIKGQIVKLISPLHNHVLAKGGLEKEEVMNEKEQLLKVYPNHSDI